MFTNRRKGEGGKNTKGEKNGKCRRYEGGREGETGAGGGRGSVERGRMHRRLGRLRAKPATKGSRIIKCQIQKIEHKSTLWN